MAAVLLALVPLPVWSAPFQSHGSIRQTVKAFLAQGMEPAGSDIDVSVGSLDPRLRLPQCDQPLQAFATGNARRMGRTTVGVRCRGAHPWTLYVTARVSVYASVVVAARSMARGELVGKGDLQLQRKDVSRLNFGYLTRIQQATDKTLQRNIVAGAVIRPNQLNDPALVHRGESVTLDAQAGGIQVRMAGKALDDGALGQRIRVRNLSSNRVVEGTVGADGVVKVDL